MVRVADHVDFRPRDDIDDDVLALGELPEMRRPAARTAADVEHARIGDRQHGFGEAVGQALQVVHVGALRREVAQDQTDDIAGVRLEDDRVVQRRCLHRPHVLQAEHGRSTGRRGGVRHRDVGNLGEELSLFGSYRRDGRPIVVGLAGQPHRVEELGQHVQRDMEIVDIHPAMAFLFEMRRASTLPTGPDSQSCVSAAHCVGPSSALHGSLSLMTILVTGGAGYIGSHTVRALTNANVQVVVLDTLELGRADSVIDADIAIGDIADEGLVESLCREHDVSAVVHFAAYKNVGESMREPAKYFHNNIDGTVHMLEAALRAGVDQVVFSSSCSVNGTPDSVPVAEDAAIHPESVYAETKAIMERVLRWYGVTRGLRSVSLRYFNAAGASSDGRIGEDWAYSQNLIPLAMKSLLLGEPTLQIYGSDYPTPDGTCIRDYIHVEDLADAHVKALGYLERGGDTTAINIGTGIGSSVMEVLHTIEAVAGRPVPHDLVDRRAGDPVATYADPSKAKQVLGWEAQFGLNEIVESAHTWHRSESQRSRA